MKRKKLEKLYKDVGEGRDIPIQVKDNTINGIEVRYGIPVIITESKGKFFFSISNVGEFYVYVKGIRCDICTKISKRVLTKIVIKTFNICRQLEKYKNTLGDN